MEFLTRLADRIDRLNEFVGKGVSWVTTLLVAIVFIDVVMRYAFNTSFVFVQELEWHLFAFIFLIGAGYTLLHDGHVRVDIVYQRVSSKTRAWINVVGCVLFLFPGCYLVIHTSIVFVVSAIVKGNLYIWEGSPDPGGIPLRFIVKSLIPIGFVLLILQGFSIFVRNLRIIMGLDSEGEVAD